MGKIFDVLQKSDSIPKSKRKGVKPPEGATQSNKGQGMPTEGPNGVQSPASRLRQLDSEDTETSTRTKPGSAQKATIQRPVDAGERARNSSAHRQPDESTRPAVFNNGKQDFRTEYVQYANSPPIIQREIIREVEPSTSPPKIEEEPVTPQPAPIPEARKLSDNIDLPGFPVTGNYFMLKEHFRTIKTQLLHVMKEKKFRTVLITSAAEKEGKSFISANLAASIATSIDEYVLLVETDFRRPVLAERAQLENKIGLSEFLSGDVTEVEKIIVPTGLPKLSVVTAGQKMESASNLLLSDLMNKLLLHFKTRYEDRIIIIDSPPVHLAETISLSQMVDCIVLVMDKKKTGRKQLKSAMELLDKEKIVGILMNNFGNVKKTTYGYYSTDKPKSKTPKRSGK